MAADGLPIVLPLLKDEPSDAADDALLAALPSAAPRTRRAILNALAERGRPRAGVELLRLSAQSPADLAPLITEYAEALHAPLRSMIAAADSSDRRTAIDFIVAANDVRSSYLLAEALRHKDGRTRELCAAALLNLTTAALQAREQATPPATADNDNASLHSRNVENAETASNPLDELAAALSEGLRAWESHLQPPVLHAALLLLDRTEPALRAKLADPHTRFAHAAANAIESCHEPRLAGAVLRALAIPELRAAAGQCLVRARQRPFIDAVLAESWLLADPAIHHGCRWARMDHWDEEWIAALLQAPPQVADLSVRLVAAAGGSPSARDEAYKVLLSRGGEHLRRAAFWQLVEDSSTASTQLLTALAARHDDELAEPARREVRRREIGSGVVRPVKPDGPARDSAAMPHSNDKPITTRESIAAAIDAAASPPAPTSGSTVATPKHGRSPIRELLASCSAVDRLDALQAVRRAGSAAEHAESVYRLCGDADPAVRAAAVAALEHLPGPTALRILRQALNDPEPRVQANAIEALDAIGVSERARLVAIKLNAPDNRVRANAIRTCLRAEMHQAAEALLDMLDSPSAMHRAGALWVVEQLRLVSVGPRVREIMDSDPDAGVRERARAAFHALSAMRGGARARASA